MSPSAPGGFNNVTTHWDPITMQENLDNDNTFQCFLMLTWAFWWKVYMIPYCCILCTGSTFLEGLESCEKLRPPAASRFYISKSKISDLWTANVMSLFSQNTLQHGRGSDSFCMKADMSLVCAYSVADITPLYRFNKDQSDQRSSRKLWNVTHCSIITHSKWASFSCYPLCLFVILSGPVHSSDPANWYAIILSNIFPLFFPLSCQLKKQQTGICLHGTAW